MSVTICHELYDVIIRGAMLIDISSWKRSLQAYGIRTREIWKIREVITAPAADQDGPAPAP